MEKTLVLIKPDAVQRGLIGKIISRFEQKGLKIVGMKMIKIDSELAKQHYAHLVSKPFFPDLEKFITSTPVVALVLEGKEAVRIVRNLMGPTNSRNASPGTIRGDFSNSTSRNIVHGSDSVENAIKEINRFFKQDEIFEYKCYLLDFFYAGDEK